MSYCLRCGEKTPWWKFWGVHICPSDRHVQMVDEHQPLHRGKVRVSDLRQIDVPAKEDVFLIADVSDKESKKITLAQLKAFIRS